MAGSPAEARHGCALGAAVPADLGGCRHHSRLSLLPPLLRAAAGRSWGYGIPAPGRAPVQQIRPNRLQRASEVSVRAPTDAVTESPAFTPRRAATRAGSVARTVYSPPPLTLMMSNAPGPSTLVTRPTMTEAPAPMPPGVRAI